MHDKRSGGPRSSTMAKDQLEQQQRAEASAAAAEHVHKVPALGNITIHKDTLAQAPPTDDDSNAQKSPQIDSQNGGDQPKVGSSLNQARLSTDKPLSESQQSERNLAHEAALRRLDGLDSSTPGRKRSPEASSVASTQPVLVREYSQSPASRNDTRLSRMRQRKKSSKDQQSSEIPSLESFSFQDILTSIDPEVRGSIDRIAEICGRSKMSLADEYSSHMPPQGDLSIPVLQEHIDQVAISRLDPVEEASSTHEQVLPPSGSTRSRANRLSLAARSTTANGDILSATTISTSAVTSHVQSIGNEEVEREPNVRESYIPQLVAWLRSSQGTSIRSSPASRRHSGAIDALQRALGDSAGTAMQ
ncbi:MAG: hypothetical protein Q9220_004141 [cf. Caloplaca sp. 1 TL-2023]